MATVEKENGSFRERPLVTDHTNFQRNLRPDFSVQQSAEDDGNLHQVVETERKAGLEKMGQISKNFCGRALAPESLKTRRAREKLLKQWEAEKEQFTPTAIAETVDKIHKWIADNAKHRVLIKEKSIRLFNQNQNAAEISKKVQGFAEKLKDDMQHFGKVF